MADQSDTADVRPDLIDLPELTFARRRHGRRFDVLRATVATRFETCGRPSCCKRFVRFGARTTRVSDEPLRGQPIYLEMPVQRYRCAEHGHTFAHPVYAFDQRYRMTRRLIMAAINECVHGTFESAGRRFGKAPTTIARMFSDFDRAAEACYSPIAPEFIGLDEVYVRPGAKAYAIITDVGRRRVVDLLPGYSKEALVGGLRRLANLDRARAIVMDMSPTNRAAAILAVPKAKVVVDPWHVSTAAVRAVDRLRKELQLELRAYEARRLKSARAHVKTPWHELSEGGRAEVGEWFRRFPRLEAAYRAKDDLYGVWQQKTYDAARITLERWRRGLTPETERTFAELLTAIDNWEPEILNRVRFNISNGFTEASNREVKRIFRRGERLSFPLLRRKVLAARGDCTVETVFRLLDGAQDSAGDRRIVLDPTLGSADPARALSVKALARRRWSFRDYGPRRGRGACRQIPARQFEHFVNSGPLFEFAVRSTAKAGKPSPVVAFIVASAPYMLAA